MAVLDNELLEDAALDAEIVSHVQRTLPAEVAARFDEEQLYYFHDLIEEFLAESDILEAEPDERGFCQCRFGTHSRHLAPHGTQRQGGRFRGRRP